MLLLLLWGLSSCELLSQGLSYLRKAMLLSLGLLGGANSTVLVCSINTLLTYLQVNSSLLFTSHDTIAYTQLQCAEIAEYRPQKVISKDVFTKGTTYLKKQFSPTFISGKFIFSNDYVSCLCQLIHITEGTNNSYKNVYKNLMPLQLIKNIGPKELKYQLS